ncbi:hypothetical protein A3A79_01640 [Candidatus Gottesmanbacteria bacterium RIFCSPLOWO2_01_FULL_43_11b]|uniref:Nucleoside triphosphate pyrophosphatase n=1 Tax=Candidatus Gottesmanbacteria bacterium RIFCSPLOWO2_01_FULL_43_11b TaxID=1798392 RepID=A0A1F6AHK9_9BACT|nr:MAG: hypothetical protein A3A79_01640 [Candidatus Gottesmanbacteria bacterium RIFCSPLOWO2_01_FULL_43_11b]
MAIRFSSPNAIPIEPPVDLILASQSIGRRALLEKLGVRFRIIATHINEDNIQGGDPIGTLRKRAAAKADEIAGHPGVYGVSETAKTLVIAADSMGFIGKRTFGKPADREHVKTLLKSLMGKTHTFGTAIHLVYLVAGKVKKSWEKVVKTKVTLKKLTPVEIESYVARYDLSRFAAGYAFNEAPWDLVTKIDGSYTNVIGLPFEVLLPILRSLKVIV